MHAKEKILSFALIGLLVLHIAAGFFPENTLWGLDYWRYIPHGFLFIILIIIVYAAIMLITKKLKKTLFNNINLFFLEKKKLWIPLISAVIGACIFYLFRVKTFFLGDGYLIIRSMEQSYRYSVTEPLDVFIHSICYKILSSTISWDAVQTYLLISIVCGASFIFLVTYYKKLLGETAHQQWVTIFALCTTGTMLLFFGYAESYSIAAVLQFGFLIAGLHSIEKKKSPLSSSFLLGWSTIVHTSSINLLPALGYLWISYMRKTPGVGEKILKGAAGAGLFILPSLITLLTFVLGNFPLSYFFTLYSGKNHFIPLKGAEESSLFAYNLISFPHLIDVINELFLIAPLFFIWIFILIAWKKKILYQHTPQWLFLAVAAGIYLICLSVFNLMIGASRDWDLLSSMAFPLTLLVMRSIFIVKHLLSRKELILLVLVSLLHIIPWVGVNTSEEWSLQRFKGMVSDEKWSPAARAEALDELRYYYSEKGSYEDALNYARKSALTLERGRYYHNWASTEFLLNHFDKAAEIFQKALELDPTITDTYLYYGTLLLINHQFRKAQEIIESSKHKLNTADLYYRIALLLIDMERYTEAIIALKRTLELEPVFPEATFLLERLSR